jgi:hypothetical protein
MFTKTDLEILGAGFVTKPTLDILSDSGIEVSVGRSPIVYHIKA